MRLRRFLVIAAAVGLIVFVAVAVRAYIVYSDAKQAEETAALANLQQSVMRELHTYYLKHRRYPNSLKELPINSLQGSEAGASLELLQRLNYRPDGYRYIITRAGKYGTHKVSVTGTNPPVLEYLHKKN